MAENGHTKDIRDQIEAALDECRKLVAEMTTENFDETAILLTRKGKWFEEAILALVDEQRAADEQLARRRLKIV